MNAAASPLTLLRAQLAAETTTRLRSLPSALALLAILAASFAWIPDPAKNATSLSWRPLDQPEHVISGLYTSTYLGTASALLSALFLSLIGFYLVAGSIARDRRSGVGAILAATPLSSFGYLAGKVVAHASYLAIVGLAALASGVAIFAVYGVGSFDPIAFLIPYGLLVLPAMLCVAAVAVFFDVTPGLRGRGGLVVYFFVWAFGLLIIPGLMAGELREDGFDGRRAPIYDPLGMASTIRAIELSTDDTASNVSIGLEFVPTPIERVDWAGPRWTADLVGLRFAQALVALALIGLSTLIFDRFDPARGRRWMPKAPAPAGVLQPFEPAPRSQGSLAELGVPQLRPSMAGAVLAEARLIWANAGHLRWLLVLAALGAGTPEIERASVAVFLLVLAPVLAEVSARERLAGTMGLIGAQPSVPGVWSWWKLAATLLVLGPLALPRLLYTAVADPASFADRGLAFVVGLVFVALFAVAAGQSTGGGKLFTGVYVALWYGALNGAPAFDFAGALSAAPSLATASIFAGCALPLFLLATALEPRLTRST